MYEIPEELWERDPFDPRFQADDFLNEWVRENIICEGPLNNPDHKHLKLARIGFLWTNVELSRLDQQIAGTAQIGQPGGAAWAKAKAEIQIRAWFGQIPDFIITLDAPYFAMCETATQLAIIEHELYHCAQAKDKNGFPKYTKETNWPVWGMRGHDVEEFVGVVRRYGAGASGVTAMVDAANRGAEIMAAKISKVCGTCLRIA